jgi:hypothetical protein
MAAHRPVEITFATAAEAAPLIQWLEDSRELAWLTHARGHKDQNLALQSSAVAMLKGSDTSFSLATYNKTLAQQQWQAFREFAFTSPGDYLLWHTRSGQVDSASLLVRGRSRILVEDPFTAGVTPIRAPIQVGLLAQRIPGCSTSTTQLATHLTRWWASRS